MNRVTLGLLVLRRSGFRVVELMMGGKLSLARSGLGRCLAVDACILGRRDTRLLPMKMSLELVWASMLLERQVAVVEAFCCLMWC